MTNKHYTGKIKIGFIIGSYCKKCLNWSSMPDGLKDEECTATKEEIKENKKNGTISHKAEQKDF